jgi:hypothetical protein
MSEYVDLGEVLDTLALCAAANAHNTIVRFRQSGDGMTVSQEIMFWKGVLLDYQSDVAHLTGTSATKKIPALRKQPPFELRQRVLDRDGSRCLRCNTREDLHMDHIVPVVHGGMTTFENLQTLCGTCNRWKGTDVLSYVQPDESCGVTP